MRKYLVATLALGLMVMASMLYKQSRANVLLGFEKGVPAQASEPILYLYGFFSGDSCMPCGEAIGVLNELPDYFKVTGVVPDSEVPRIELLREQYQIRFPVYGREKYRRYGPIVNPTIIGASRKGRILFILPCLTLRPEETRTFLMCFHMKLAPYLANESF